MVGGTVVGIDGGPALKGATVLIAGERISQIGRADSTPIPPGAKVIAMTGRWLIPGLTNAHVHLGLKLPGQAELAGLGDRHRGAADVLAGEVPGLSLLSGVTTLRLVGEDHGTSLRCTRAIDSGEVVGPPHRDAGEVIIPTGGHGSMEADGPYGFAHVVRAQIKSGADWIKIAISGGISDPRGSISAAPMTDEEMSTLIEVAHRNGIRVTAHNGSNKAARQALRFTASAASNMAII